MNQQRCYYCVHIVFVSVNFGVVNEILTNEGCCEMRQNGMVAFVCMW